MTRLVVCTVVLTLSLRGGEADVAISGKSVTVKRRLVRIIGSLRFPGWHRGFALRCGHFRCTMAAYLLGGQPTTWVNLWEKYWGEVKPSSSEIWNTVFSWADSSSLATWMRS